MNENDDDIGFQAFFRYKDGEEFAMLIKGKGNIQSALKVAEIEEKESDAICIRIEEWTRKEHIERYREALEDQKAIRTFQRDCLDQYVISRHRRRIPGGWKGKVKIHENFDDPLLEFDDDDIINLKKEFEETKKTLENLCRIVGISPQAAACLPSEKTELTQEEIEYGQKLCKGYKIGRPLAPIGYTNGLEIAGYGYYDSHYPDEGIVGPFDTKEEAQAHALIAYHDEGLFDVVALSKDEIREIECEHGIKGAFSDPAICSACVAEKEGIKSRIIDISPRVLSKDQLIQIECEHGIEGAFYDPAICSACVAKKEGIKGK